MCKMSAGNLLFDLQTEQFIYLYNLESLKKILIQQRKKVNLNSIKFNELLEVESKTTGLCLSLITLFLLSMRLSCIRPRCPCKESSKQIQAEGQSQLFQVKFKCVSRPVPHLPSTSALTFICIALLQCNILCTSLSFLYNSCVTSHFIPFFKEI